MRDTINQYKEFFDCGGFELAYLVYRRKDMKIKRMGQGYSIADVLYLKDTGDGAVVSNFERAVCSAESREYDDIYALVEAILSAIESLRPTAKAKYNTARADLLLNYYAHGHTLAECGDWRAKTRALKALLEVIANNHIEKTVDYSFTESAQIIAKINKAILLSKHDIDYQTKARWALRAYKAREFWDFRSIISEKQWNNDEDIEAALIAIDNQLTISKMFKSENIKPVLREDLSSNGLVDIYRILKKIDTSIQILRHERRSYWQDLERLYAKEIYHGGKALELFAALLVDFTKI